MSTLPLSWLTDAQLQQRIDSFARQMLEAQARYARSHSIEDRSERDQAWLAQKAHLKERGRRRRIVEDMERGAGLA